MGHVPPSTSNNFILSSLCSKSQSQLSKYHIVCEISWCRCRQLAALAELLVIEQLLHPALKFAVSALWANLQLCPSLQQILATPLAAITNYILKAQNYAATGICCRKCLNRLSWVDIITFDSIHNRSFRTENNGGMGCGMGTVRDGVSQNCMPTHIFVLNLT